MKSSDHARSLLRLAEDDLRTAEIGLEHGAPLNTVCFHLQQTVEKLLKAVLACRDLEYPLTHDLDKLLDLAVREHPLLAQFRNSLESFAQYAVRMRYEVHLYPDREEAQAAMETTRKIREAVYSSMPPEALL